MVTEKNNMITEVVASDDGKHTFEIRKQWDENKGKGIIIELYPTISKNEVNMMDISTLHLLNHASELGWGSVRILNLFSTVFKGKPLVKRLGEDLDNLNYIKEVFESEDITDYDIVIAWGTSLATNKRTQNYKLELLNTLKKQKLTKQVKQIEVDCRGEEIKDGMHPLFLGLHYSRNKWCLKPYPLSKVISDITNYFTNDTRKVAKPKKKKSESEDEENVSEDNE